MEKNVTFICVLRYIIIYCSIVSLKHTIMNNDKRVKMSKPQAMMIAMRLLRDSIYHELLEVEIKKDSEGKIDGYRFWIHSMDVMSASRVADVVQKPLFLLYPHMGIKDDQYINAALI